MLIGANGTVGALATWANNSRIANDVPEIILEAESEIYRRLRHWRMLTLPVAGTFTIGSDVIQLPADCLEPYFLQFTGIYQQTIPQLSPTAVMQAWTYDGSGNRVAQQPQCYSFNQTNMFFDSLADQAYGYAFIYFQQPQALATTITNFLTQFYPALVRAACMLGVCQWLKDFGQGGADKTYWVELFEERMDKAQFESDRARRAQEVSPILVGGQGAGYSSTPPYGANW